jgi:hypothetical protein
MCVKTSHLHPATCYMVHWLTRHCSPTIYRCFALPQVLCRWRHQFGIFWVHSCIWLNVGHFNSFTPVSSTSRLVTQNCEMWLLGSSDFSVLMEHLGWQWTGFREIWVFFENMSRKLKFLKKSNKNNAHFTWRPIRNCCCSLLSASENEKCFTPKF